MNRHCKKFGHRKYAKALAHKARLEKQGDDYLNVYWCEFHRRWHVGHQQKDVPQK